MGQQEGTTMRPIQIFALSMIIGFACTAVAKDYCPKVPEAKKERDPWHITESAFTKEAANKALKELSAQINEGVSGRDFLIEDDLNMIKGYLYRAYLAQHEKDFNSEDADLKKEFCDFLKTQAYVHH
jgi:hypothetical protein